MSEKKRKWSPVKEMLFTYLAVTKILYWFNTITALNQSDLGYVGRSVLTRLLSQDILIITGVVFFFYLDKLAFFKKSKYNKIIENIVFYALGYVVIMGVGFLYFWIMSRFLETTQTYQWGFTLAYGTVGYVVVCIVFSIKEYSKSKDKELSGNTASVHGAEDKAAMLKALLDDGVLTQEEYDRKMELIT